MQRELLEEAGVSDITQEQFDEKLWELVGQMTSAELEALPGFYEIVSEELNNEVIEAIEKDRE